MGRSKVPGARCAVCDTVMVEVRLNLDLLMADPSRWPSSVWDRWDAPRGPEIPPAMRLWGAVATGMAWLAEHGYGDLNKAQLTEHYHRHVPLLPTNVDELVEAGIMADGSKALATAPKLNPLAYLELYNKGIEAGKKGIDLLMAHVAELEEKKLPVPVTLMKLLVDVGGKLAVSQAGIVSRQPSQPTLDDDEGFRTRDDHSGGEHIGHGRMRTLDGKVTFIRDEGPKDRATYEARSRQEGGTGLS